MEKKLKSTSSTMIADSFVFGKMLMKKKHVSWIHEKCHGNFEVPFDHLTYPNTDHYNLVLPEKEKKKPGLTAKIDFVAKWSKCA